MFSTTTSITRIIIVTLCLSAFALPVSHAQNGADNAQAFEKDDDYPVVVLDKASKMYNLLRSLPPSVFAHTSSGIDREGMSGLCEKGQSVDWRIAAAGDNQLTIKYRHFHDSKLLIRAFEMGANVVAVIETTNAQVCTLEAWLYLTDVRVSYEIDMIPEVSINEFYSKQDQFAHPGDYQYAVVPCLEDDGTIQYALETWNDSAFENKKPINSFIAVWEGSGFRLKRIDG